MTGTRMSHTWVRSSDRHIAVRVQMPADGNICGVTVVVPPAGRERVNFYRSLSALSADAATRGHCVWTPALTGEGDSSGRADVEDLGGAWVSDVEAVVEAAALSAPGLPLTLVGVRLGGALASSVNHPALRTVVLWAPLSGRQYVRAQQMLASIALEGTPHRSEHEFVGDDFTEVQLDSMRALKVQPSPQSDGVRVIRVDGDPDPSRNPDWHPQLTRIARAGIETVVGALAVGAKTSSSWTPTTSMTMSRPSGVVTETFVDVGPHALVGVLTEPSEPEGAKTPAVIFTATGAETREGPGQIWAMIARSLADTGVTSIRLDRRLLGDDTDVTQDRAPNPYHDDAVDDLVVAGAWLRERGHRIVTGVGLCSGAWLFLRAAAHTQLDRVVVINCVFWSTGARSAADAFDLSLAWSERGLELRSDDESAPRSLRDRVAVSVRGVLRRRPWIRGALLSARHGGIGAPLVRAAARATRVTTVCGPDEATILRALGGQVVVGGSPRFTAHTVEGLEHSLFTAWSRNTVHDLVVTTMAGSDEG